MASVFNIPSAAYPQGTHLETTQNIPQSAKRIRMTITREGWPPGIPYVLPNSNPPKTLYNTAGSIYITYPDGTAGPGQTFWGGSIYRQGATGKRLSPMLVPAGFRFDYTAFELDGTMQLIESPGAIAFDTLVTEEFFEFSWFNSETGALDLPKGQYVFAGDCFVALTTAIKAERF